ncbi:MAG TPA: hypothetical protein VI112_17895 [Bacteroidia bacterium]|jgi:hypothetical protein
MIIKNKRIDLLFLVTGLILGVLNVCEGAALFSRAEISDSANYFVRSSVFTGTLVFAAFAFFAIVYAFVDARKKNFRNKMLSFHYIASTLSSVFITLISPLVVKYQSMETPLYNSSDWNMPGLNIMVTSIFYIFLFAQLVFILNIVLSFTSKKLAAN